VSIILPRPFYLVLQCTFFGENGKNFGVSVRELVFCHSEIYENQFAFGFAQRITATTLFPKRLIPV